MSHIATEGVEYLFMADSVSLREACRLLAEASVASERTAREIVWAGLAGPPIMRRGTATYLRTAIDEICRRPRVDLASVGVRPLLVLRMPAVFEVPEDARGWLGYDASADADDQAARIAGFWVAPPGGRPGLLSRIGASGFVPLVVTVGGVVTRSFEIVDVSPVEERRVSFELRASGPWRASIDGHLLSTGRGAPLVWAS